eukprot:g21279.t1
MKNEDVSEGSRELVDLSAEAISSLGFHLSQVGQIISKSTLPPQRGDRSAAFKLKEKLEMYQGYTDEIQRRKNELEQKMAEDFARLKAWRAQSGTEGKGLVEELEALYAKVRLQELHPAGPGGLSGQRDKEIKHKQKLIEEEQAKVEELLEAVALRDRKWDSLAQRGSLCSWLQCAFDEARFKWKAAEEKEKLKIEHHQRMRQARAQARIEVIQRERQKRLIQACMLSLQEETVEGRQARHLEELRRKHEDEVLVFNAQLAQAMGDEEKAKELVAEQTRLYAVWVCLVRPEDTFAIGPGQLRPSASCRSIGSRKPLPREHTAQVGVDSFGLGILVGVFGTVSTIAAVLSIFVNNLRGVDFDGGNALASSGGFVMPNFFFQGARDIFSNVRQDAAQSTQRFKDLRHLESETGRFAEIYAGIERSQEMAMLRSIDALREQVPPGALREILFSVLRRAALSSSQLASALYDFALRLQAKEPARNEDTVEIQSELWALDEGRCEVSARRLGEGGRRPWVNADAEILLDEQVPALRTTLAECAKRPLFAQVAPEILARPTFLTLVRIFDVFQPAEIRKTSENNAGPYSPAEFNAIDEFLEQVTRTSVMRRAFRHITKTLPIPCVFEHVFLGNLTEDISGQPVAGGFHSWLKFYLEEVRGTARYLGYIYNNAEAGLVNSRFVSGKFVWDYDDVLVEDSGHLVTSYAIYLGPEVPKDTSGRPGREQICTSAELAELLPRWLVEDGIALHEDSDLSKDGKCRGSTCLQECVRFCVARGCRSVAEALVALREALIFDLEDAVGAAKEGYPRILALVEDTLEVVPVLLRHSDHLSAHLPKLLEKLRSQGRRGPRLHQPIRLLLTGRANGAPIAELVSLLELAQWQGGDEAGVRLTDRIALIRIEEARRMQGEAEREMKLAQRDRGEWAAWAESEESRRVAEGERDDAFRAKDAAEAAESYAKEQAEVFQQARLKAEMRQRKAEEQARAKHKKIQSLQRMLAELGAESDSDAPPDERAPAFFVNEDGTKVPRPRTRKERMGMAFREAESARYELRLGMVPASQGGG